MSLRLTLHDALTCVVGIYHPSRSPGSAWAAELNTRRRRGRAALKAAGHRYCSSAVDVACCPLLIARRPLLVVGRSSLIGRRRRLLPIARRLSVIARRSLLIARRPLFIVGGHRSSPWAVARW
ncbi:hypothetical protein [Streptomyces longisporoflavus]|uniref:Uncharacterized protein n=1 Tax=Streptomyces longisporoflavus TaxID=28044 RepID=A0ABW7R816_9ACTN